MSVSVCVCVFALCVHHLLTVSVYSMCAQVCASCRIRIQTAVIEGYYCHLLSHKRLSSLKCSQGVTVQMGRSDAHALTNS